jgi:hypothetical protein
LPVLHLDLDTVRLFLHVLAACVWVGGQLTLVLTGIWNVAAEQDDHGSAWDHTLVLKLVLVALSGVTAYLHARASSRAAMAAYGALTGLTALGALFVGVWLAG